MSFIDIETLRTEIDWCKGQIKINNKINKSCKEWIKFNEEFINLKKNVIKEHYDYDTVRLAIEDILWQKGIKETYEIAKEILGLKYIEIK